MRDILNDLEAGRHLSDPDPVKRAQNQMRAAAPKRFYSKVSIEPDQLGEGFRVHLDGKPVRTPAGTVMELPTRQAAALVASEFDSQIETLDMVTMPTMRLANTVIDGVAREAEAVFEDILRFVSSDLLFYRADAPEELVELQTAAWDPVLDWARNAIGARFSLAQGVIHVDQPREAVGAIAIHLRGRSDPFRLAALHLMTSLTGSALLAIAVEANAIEPDKAWAAAHVDEHWNEAHWGVDSEAVARRNARKRDFDASVRMLEALTGQ